MMTIDLRRKQLTKNPQKSREIQSAMLDSPDRMIWWRCVNTSRQECLDLNHAYKIMAVTFSFLEHYRNIWKKEVSLWVASNRVLTITHKLNKHLWTKKNISYMNVPQCTVYTYLDQKIICLVAARFIHLGNFTVNGAHLFRSENHMSGRCKIYTSGQFHCELCTLI